MIHKFIQCISRLRYSKAEALFFCTFTLLLSGCGGGGGGGGNTAAAPVDVGNVAFWSFDNMVGATAPNTTLPGLDAVANFASLAPGRFGNALLFDATIQQSYAVIYPNGYELNFPGGVISIAMWIKPTLVGSTASYHLFGGGVGGLQSFDLRLVNGKITFYLRPLYGTQSDQDNIIVASNTSVLAGTWTHVALTYDGNLAKVYFNGAADASKNILNSVNTIHNALYLGGLPVNNYNPAALTFPGIIDELELTASTLTTSQIAQLIAGVRP